MDTTNRILTPEQRDARRMQRDQKNRRKARAKEVLQLAIQVPLFIFIVLSFLSLPVIAIGVVWGWDLRYLATSLVCCAVSLVICLIVSNA